MGCEVCGIRAEVTLGERVAHELIRGTELKSRSSVQTQCGGAGLQSQLLGQENRVQVRRGHLSEECLKWWRKCGEMAQQLGALAPLAEDLDSVPRTHLVAHKYL